MKEITNLRRRARDVYEHHPHQLFVAVNGYVIGSQKISYPETEQTFSINISEPISFVEVFSEEGVRLLWLDVEAPPQGDVKQSERISLSDGRTLDALLVFGSYWPGLRVSYSDPSFAVELAPEARTPFPAPLTHRERPAADRDVRAPRIQPAAKHAGPLQWPLQWLGARMPGLRPAAFAALAVLVAVAGLWLLRDSVTTVSAAELLKQSFRAEKSLAAVPARVIHRTITLEERRPSTGKVLSRKKIEIWQNDSRAVARRVYDDQNRVVAGEWSRADGSRTVLDKTSPSTASSQPLPGERLASGSVWRLSPSAEDFASIIPSPKELTVEQRPSAYVLSYRSDPTQANARAPAVLLEAKLVLRQSDLHAYEQTLVVEQAGEVREYDFVEAAFEQPAASEVASSVFEPEPELFVSPAPAPPPPAPKPRESAIAAEEITPELHVDVLARLDRVNALAGEQISVTRAANGTVRVQGVVETDQRREEILAALRPIRQNAGLSVEVETVEQAQARQPRKAPPRVRLDSVALQEGGIPVRSDLKRYFAEQKRLGDEAIEKETRRFSEQVFTRSITARLRAAALQQIVESFSPEELARMDRAAHAQWRSMVNRHAQAFWREMEMLRQELQPIFLPDFSFETAPGPPTAESGLRARAALLLELATASDEALRKSFSISTGEQGPVPVRTLDFWRALRQAEAVAAEIVNAL